MVRPIGATLLDQPLCIIDEILKTPVIQVGRGKGISPNPLRG